MTEEALSQNQAGWFLGRSRRESKEAEQRTGEERAGRRQKCWNKERKVNDGRGKRAFILQGRATCLEAREVPAGSCPVAVCRKTGSC